MKNETANILMENVIVSQEKSYCTEACYFRIDENNNYNTVCKGKKCIVQQIKESRS